MYVAVCISGVPRNCYFPTWVGKICQKYNTKVFVNYWKPHADFLQHSNTPGPRDAYVLDENIYKYPNTESFFSQNDWDEMKPVFEDIFSKVELGQRVRNDLGVISMFYSLYQAQLMAEKYEQEHKIVFGVVIRSRMDTFVKAGQWDYDLTKFDLNNTLYYPDYNVNTCNDHWGFSSSEIMKKYGRVYENIVELTKKSGYWPERMLAAQLGPEIKCKTIDFVGLPRFVGGPME